MERRRNLNLGGINTGCVKCCVNPSNLVAPVKVNEKFFKKYKNHINHTSYTGAGKLFNNYKSEMKTDNFKPIHEIKENEFISAQKSFIKILISPNYSKRFSHI